MGLSLGVKEGSRILIGGGELLVKTVSSGRCQVVVQYDDPPSMLAFDIVATERTEIMPCVFCQLGKVDDHGGQSYTRLVFEAPRSIPIERL